jgi:erythromycin esterase
MGFDVLAFESGMYDCHKAWESFADDGDPANANLGVFGIWTGSKQTQSLWQYLGKQAKSEFPLELAGFDCQFTATASRESLIDDLEDFVETKTPGAVSRKELATIVEQIEQLIESQDNDLVAGFNEAIEELITKLQEVKNTDEDISFWLQNLKSIKAYAAYKAGSSRGLKGVMKRDEQMAKNLIWMHKNQFSSRKIIVWAASFHIMRNPSEIDVPGGSIDYSNMAQMGHLVDEALAGKVFTIGFTANDGTAGAYFRPKFNIGNAPQGTLENIFAQANIANGIVNLNPTDDGGKWLLEKQFSRPMGYTWMKAIWGEHFDAMVYNGEMQPSSR